MGLSTPSRPSRIIQKTSLRCTSPCLFFWYWKYLPFRWPIPCLGRRLAIGSMVGPVVKKARSLMRFWLGAYAFGFALFLFCSKAIGGRSSEDPPNGAPLDAALSPCLPSLSEGLDTSMKFSPLPCHKKCTGSEFLKLKSWLPSPCRVYLASDKSLKAVKASAAVVVK